MLINAILIWHTVLVICVLQGSYHLKEIFWCIHRSDLAQVWKEENRHNHKYNACTKMYTSFLMQTMPPSQGRKASANFTLHCKHPSMSPYSPLYKPTHVWSLSTLHCKHQCKSQYSPHSTLIIHPCLIILHTPLYKPTHVSSFSTHHCKHPPMSHHSPHSTVNTHPCLIILHTPL